MEILKPRKSSTYTIDGVRLCSSIYLKYKVEKRFVELLKEEYSQNDIVYDIVMGISSEFGTDYYIEEIIKVLEAFYNRALTYQEIKSFIEAYNDCQN
tara:strand:+ start:676 stop:966 length:291 start_codon:yes stop_codon:yes gene_type:complete